MKLHELLAVAAIGASSGRVYKVNNNYTQERDRRYAEQAKAKSKKQKVREEIRARRAVIKGETP